MSIVTEFFKQGELALAAYSSLASGISGKPYTDALEDVGMTPTQAATFAAKWNVIDQYTDITTERTIGDRPRFPASHHKL